MAEQNENARRAKARAGEYAPGELWTEVSPGIFAAASRAPEAVGCHQEQGLHVRRYLDVLHEYR
jgi:hypothetical protein